MAQKTVSYEVAKALQEAGLCYGPMTPTYIVAWLRIAIRGIKEAKMPSGVICRTMPQVYVYFKGSGETAEDDFVKSVEYVIENNLIK